MVQRAGGSKEPASSTSRSNTKCEPASVETSGIHYPGKADGKAPRPSFAGTKEEAAGAARRNHERKLKAQLHPPVGLLLLRRPSPSVSHATLT